jgi:hypothetical protein
VLALFIRAVEVVTSNCNANRACVCSTGRVGKCGSSTTTTVNDSEYKHDNDKPRGRKPRAETTFNDVVSPELGSDGPRIRHYLLYSCFPYYSQSSFGFEIKVVSS